MVYGYLLEGECEMSIAVRRGHFQCGCTYGDLDNSDTEEDAFFKLAAMNRLCCLNYDVVDMELFNMKYLGKETLREVVETWYNTRVFKIHGWQYTEPFLHTDVWDLGMLSIDYISMAHLHVGHTDLRVLQLSTTIPNYMRFFGQVDVLGCLQI
jgi:hypothetical protein